MESRDEESVRRLCILAHAAALLGLIVPLGQLLGPYLVLLLAPRGDPQVREHVLESLNLQLSVIGVVLALALLMLLAGVGAAFLLLFIPSLYGLGMTLWGATQASHGRRVRYPLIVRLLGR